MEVVVKVVPVAANGPFWTNPILLAALVTFTGVLITAVVGTVANFRLANRRNTFEQDLAREKMEQEKSLAIDKLKDEAQSREAAMKSNLRLRQIEFQRAAIVELQECLIELIRLNHGRIPDDDEALESHLRLVADKNARITLLRSRIMDDELRSETASLQRDSNRLKDVEKSDRDIEEKKILVRIMPIVEKLGASIREMDKAEMGLAEG